MGLLKGLLKAPNYNGYLEWADIEERVTKIVAEEIKRAVVELKPGGLYIIRLPEIGTDEQLTMMHEISRVAKSRGTDVVVVASNNDVQVFSMS